MPTPTPKVAPDAASTTRMRGALKQFGKKYGDDYTVRVIYTAPYAGWVHENMEMVHPNGGEAKFLQNAAAALAGRAAKIVSDVLKTGRSFLNALLAYGRAIKEESQRRCPVRTGRLRNSATVEVSKGGQSPLDPVRSEPDLPPVPPSRGEM